jgi:NADH-quinone oxidoreductase subunit M
VEHRVKEYMIAFLLLETLMIGVFVALDLVLFYLFFEAGLIPMFLIIGIWGGKDRIYAAFKFFLYTFLGSVLMLVAMIAMYVDAGTTDIAQLLTPQLRVRGRSPFWASMSSAACRRCCGWRSLPLRGQDADVAGAHLAARCPRAGADRRVGRAGGDPAEDGRLRLPALQPADVPGGVRPAGAAGAVDVGHRHRLHLACGAGAEDMKKLIAYSSVAHMGYVTMGIFAANQQGIDGAIFQMISHGFISGALFLCVGVIYDRMHTREIDAYGGLVNRMPAYALIFMLFTMANVGLPGTSGFVGEFLTLMGVFQVNTWVALWRPRG